MRRLCFIIVASMACSRPPPLDLPPPDPSSRARTYVVGDPTPKIDRMRRNAIAHGCKVEERTSGWMIACGDVQVWIVPDPNGMEVTCTGLPVNCARRGRELSRDDAADAGSD